MLDLAFVFEVAAVLLGVAGDDAAGGASRGGGTSTASTAGGPASALRYR